MSHSPERKLGSADIAALIRREIFKGNLQLHDRLASERTLAETYNVARGTIREALNHLARENLVEIRKSSGTFVIQSPHSQIIPPIEQANPLELMDTRFALEPHICRLSVLYGRRQDFDDLEELCLRMDNAVNDASAFSDADTEFHRKLAQSTRNSLLVWIIDQITSFRGQDEWKRMRHLTLDAKIIAQYNTQHRRILDAIRAREPEQAANIMKEHLETARLSLTRASDT
jgi:DNA-binding FadR family transcriptional regulator